MRRVAAVLLMLTAPGLARADGAPPWARSHPVHITITAADDITDVDVYARAHYPGLGSPVLERVTPAIPARVRFDGSGSDRNPGLTVLVIQKGHDPMQNTSPSTVLGRIATSGRVWLLHAGTVVNEVYRVERDGRGRYRLVQTYSNRSWWHTGAWCSLWFGLVAALTWLRRRWMRRAPPPSPPSPTASGEPASR